MRRIGVIRPFSKNMCSVRTSPMPSAAKPSATRASCAVSAFALEAEHSAARASEALFALADDADGAWDFEWLLPARGRAVRFASPTDARDALRGAARRAASVARAGKG